MNSPQGARGEQGNVPDHFIAKHSRIHACSVIHWLLNEVPSSHGTDVTRKLREREGGMSMNK